ncbi:MarR family winged helix-turn-helix transcriptional regulator [Actinokineospora enzanensis]|uniref:MarR family winged helix-turn-helix transcriptional regulator n=1 Tax=Actinokineospora enzanensis TaxID=155975 RepID=UPI00036FC418|nr:MarR family transcriptional regulator [Actinokineospora enzanensis]
MTAADSPTEHLRLVQDVSRLLLAVADRLQDDFAACAARLGLTGAQTKVLMALEPGEAVPMRKLAERLRYDPSNLTTLIDRLQDRAAVIRRPDQVDRRVKALMLTAEGERLRVDFMRSLTAAAGPLGHLDEGQLEILRKGLHAALSR